MRIVSLIAAVLSLTLVACTGFDAPPQVDLFGLEAGVLADPTAPVTLGFHEKFDQSTLNVRIVRYETDVEGNLLADAEEFYSYNGAEDLSTGGLHDLDKETERFFSMTLQRTLPIGPALAVIIEPGLADFAGNKWEVAQEIVFGYTFSCGTAEEEADPVPTLFPSAVHFLLVNVETPVAAQLQIFAAMQINPDNGDVIGQFTNGDRDPDIDCADHGLQSCDSTTVCRTLPTPECVPPSESVGAADEYPDYYANNVLPEGYSFTVRGCVQDQDDGSFTFANAPVDVEVLSPAITVKGINFNGSFKVEADGVLRGAGTFTAQDIFLGITPSGLGSGTIVSREVPPDEIKPGTPFPPEAE